VKAILLTRYGGVDGLELREVNEPRPGRGEVRVKVAAASVNPVDWKLRSGALKAWMPLELPAVLGRDASGEVAELGPGVTALKRGDRVFGLAGAAYAQQVVAAAEALALVPAGLDLIDAAALPVVVLTGSLLVEEAIRLERGETVLVTGAAGSVGRVATYEARRLGARVIAGVRAAQRGPAAELGAERIVALDREEELEALPELDAIADAVGGPTTARLLARLKAGGRVGSVVGAPPTDRKDIAVRAFVNHPDAPRLRRLAEAVVRGDLRIPIARRFPLAEAREAQRLAEAGGVGKVLLTM